MTTFHILLFILSFSFCRSLSRCVLDYTPPLVCDSVVYPLDPIIASNSSDVFEKKAGIMIESLRQQFKGDLNEDCDRYTVYYACATVFPRCLDSVHRNSRNLGFLPCKGICDKIHKFCKPPESFDCVYDKEYEHTYCTDYGMDTNYWVTLLILFLAFCFGGCCLLVIVKVFDMFLKSKDFKKDLKKKMREIKEEDSSTKTKAEAIGYEEYSINY